MTGLPYGLTKQQAATVAFVSVFITIIGGILLAYYYRRRNKRRLIFDNMLLGLMKPY